MSLYGTLSSSLSLVKDNVYEKGNSRVQKAHISHIISIPQSNRNGSQYRIFTNSGSEITLGAHSEPMIIITWSIIWGGDHTWQYSGINNSWW